MKRKGQGALEYLLLAGGAIMIAAIVLSILTGIGGTGAKTANAGQSTVESSLENVSKLLPQTKQTACAAHSSFSCYDSDVYWNDSCNAREEMKEECGNNSCESWQSNYCKNNNVYHSKTCYDRGCSNNNCYSNQRTEEELVQDCLGKGCENGVCNVILPCVNDCAIGEKRCSENNSETCGNYDEDSCTEWGAAQACSNGCENGNCKAQASLDCLELIPGQNNVLENRIHVVLVGFNYSSVDRFLSNASKAIEMDKIGLFSLEPFKSNKSKFNVWYVNKIGIAEDIKMDSQGVALGKDAVILSDVCTKKLGFFKEELVYPNPFFSEKMFTFFIVNKGIGGSAYSSSNVGNVEFLRSFDNSDKTGLRGALVHIPEEGQPIYINSSITYQPGTPEWDSRYENKLQSFAHEFGHAITIPNGYMPVSSMPENLKRIMDEYSNNQQYSPEMAYFYKTTNCFVGTIEECKSPATNKLFGDLIGNGCGENGVIDCCTNDSTAIHFGAPACSSNPTFHEDPNYELEVNCYNGCTEMGLYRGHFNSLMRGIPKNYSYGLVNERILKNVIDYLLALPN